MRKTKTVSIEAEGRDKGRQYIITEMSAAAAEEWAARAFAALAKGGVEVPQNVSEAGMAGIATIGLRALAHADFDDVQRLMQTMMNCVEFIPDPARPMVRRRLIEDDIEEVATRLYLRREVIELHTGFFIGGGRSASPGDTMMMANGAATRTSPIPSRPS